MWLLVFKMKVKDTSPHKNPHSTSERGFSFVINSRYKISTRLVLLRLLRFCRRGM